MSFVAGICVGLIGSYVVNLVGWYLIFRKMEKDGRP